MWIFDKLFNRKIEGKSSLDDLAENVVVNKETNTTEIVGNLDVSGNITKNGQPIGGGTKLYKHFLVSSTIGYEFTLITTNPQPIDFSTIDTYSKLHNFLISNNVLLFVGSSGQEIFYDLVGNAFYSTQITNIQNNNICTVGNYYDDWPLSDTTDTVSEL